MKLSFKVEQPTGPYRSFSHAYCHIKADKQAVGNIGYLDRRLGYAVTLKVAIPTTDRCQWRNITLKKTFEGFGNKAQLDAAKAWVKANWETLSTHWPLFKDGDKS